MKPIRIFLLLLLTLFISCNGKNEPTLNTGVNALSKNINLAVKPVAARWTFSSTAGGLGPTDYTIVAVLKYNHADWLSLYNKHKALEPADANYSSKEILRNWYPDSVKACFKDNGGYLYISRKAYTVDAFAKNSFIHGFCFLTDNDEVFLYTYTM